MQLLPQASRALPRQQRRANDTRADEAQSPLYHSLPNAQIPTFFWLILCTQEYSLRLPQPSRSGRKLYNARDAAMPVAPGHACTLALTLHLLQSIVLFR